MFECNDMIVDNVFMQCVSKFQQFDVMVMFNFYGGILFNIVVVFVGGFGVVFGCNMGCDVVVFEFGCRYVGFDIKGKDQVNFIVFFFSGIMFFCYFGFDDYVNCIFNVVYSVIVEG